MVLTADNNRRRQLPRVIRTALYDPTKKYIARQAVSPSIDVGDELQAQKAPFTTRTITDVSVANPTVITSAGHGLATGDQIIISGNDSTPSLNGVQKVTVLDANTFTVPVNVTVDGTGDGGGTFIQGTPNLAALLKRGAVAPATDA